MMIIEVPFDVDYVKTAANVNVDIVIIVPIIFCRVGSMWVT
jgi:hypothetical protein